MLGEGRAGECVDGEGRARALYQDDFVAERLVQRRDEVAEVVWPAEESAQGVDIDMIDVD